MSISPLSALASVSSTTDADIETPGDAVDALPPLFPYLPEGMAKKQNHQCNLEVYLECEAVGGRHSPWGRHMRLSLQRRGITVQPTTRDKSEEDATLTFLFATDSAETDPLEIPGYRVVTWTQLVGLVYQAEVTAQTYKSLKLKVPAEGFPLSSVALTAAYKAHPGLLEAYKRQVGKWGPPVDIRPYLLKSLPATPRVDVTPVVKNDTTIASSPAGGEANLGGEARPSTASKDASAPSAYSDHPSPSTSSSSTPTCLISTPTPSSPSSAVRPTSTDLDTASDTTPAVETTKVNGSGEGEKRKADSSPDEVEHKRMRTEAGPLTFPPPDPSILEDDRHLQVLFAPQSTQDWIEFQTDVNRVSMTLLDGRGFYLNLAKPTEWPIPVAHHDIVPMPIHQFPSVANPLMDPRTLVYLHVKPKRHWIRLTEAAANLLALGEAKPAPASETVSFIGRIAARLGDELSRRWNMASTLQESQELLLEAKDLIEELKDELLELGPQLNDMVNQVNDHVYQRRYLACDLRDSEGQVKKMAGELVSLRERVVTLEGDLARRTSLEVELSKAGTAQRQAVDDELASWRKAQRLEDERTALLAREEQLRGVVESLAERVASAKKKESEALSEKDEVTRRLQSVTAERDRLAADNQRLQRALFDQRHGSHGSKRKRKM